MLSGLNLQIADAAVKSGFNTLDQVALLDLIWSVRRVAFTHAVKWPRVKRPPPHPIYPDRFRPSGEGDNTRKPHKRCRDEYNHRPRHHTQGTFVNPIDLDADGVKQETGFDVKRRKLHEGQVVRHTIKTPPSGRNVNPIHSSHLDGVVRSNVDKRSSTISVPSPPSLDVPAARESSHVPRLYPQPPLCDQSIEAQTSHGLRNVKVALRENGFAVEKCRDTMRRLFEMNADLWAGEVFDVLVQLKETMDVCTQGALNGVRYIEMVENDLRDSKHGIE